MCTDNIFSFLQNVYFFSDKRLPVRAQIWAPREHARRAAGGGGGREQRQVDGEKLRQHLGLAPDTAAACAVISIEQCDASPSCYYLFKLVHNKIFRYKEQRKATIEPKNFSRYIALHCYKEKNLVSRMTLLVVLFLFVVTACADPAVEIISRPKQHHQHPTWSVQWKHCLWEVLGTSSLNWIKPKLSTKQTKIT